MSLKDLFSAAAEEEGTCREGEGKGGGQTREEDGDVLKFSRNPISPLGHERREGGAKKWCWAVVFLRINGDG